MAMMTERAECSGPPGGVHAHRGGILTAAPPRNSPGAPRP